MKKAAICFTRNGMAVIERMNRAAEAAGIRPAEAYVRMADAGSCPGDRCSPAGKTEGEDGSGGFCSSGKTGSGGTGEDVCPGSFRRVTEAPEEWAAERFRERAALIFVGAAGIAVRAIAGSVRDKLQDSPVIVIDDEGQFVIPILSGHAGGANKLAAVLAELIGAVPVITTATDRNEAFSADVFAGEYGLRIRNREGIRKVSAKALEGKPVTLSVKNYPPKEPVDLIIADETDREYSLLLSPKPYVLGAGLRRNADPEQAERFWLETLRNSGISVEEIYAFCTIDIKEQEPAVRVFCDKYRLPLITFEAELLEKAGGNFTASDFVRRTVGTDNVCERAAVLGAGPGAELIVKKQVGHGVTAAVAGRRIR